MSFQTAEVRISVVLVCAGWLSFISATRAGGPPRGVITSDDISVVEAKTIALLNLTAGEVVTVQFLQTAEASIRAIFPVGEELRTLELVSESVRAPDYQLLTQQPDGSYVDRKSTRLNSSHSRASRMPSSA